jgi:hypothetical protein
MIRQGDITTMTRDTMDKRTLLALVEKTLLEFPPQKDSDNVRSFRSISVDHLEGKITHPQFNLLYTEENTAEQITDAILHILNVGQARMPVNQKQTNETVPKKWHLQGHRSRRFWEGCFVRPPNATGALPESD